MRYALLLLLILPLISKAQIIQSSCEAPDSVRDRFERSAQVLMVQNLESRQSPAADSINIPLAYSDTLLRALIAVYNANLAASDTVFKQLDIQAMSSPDLEMFSLMADGNLPWMQNFAANQLPVGQNEVDSLMQKYQIIFHYYFSGFSADFVDFKTSYPLNTFALSRAFKNITGVQEAYPNSFFGGNKNIYDSIYENFIELEFYYGWGDCPAGCIYHRTWKFRVFWDCRVEYLGSSGNQLLGQVNIQIPEIQVFPNPFQDELRIKSKTTHFSYQLVSAKGQVLASGKEGFEIFNTKELPGGVYLLQLQFASGKNSQYKLLKIEN